jgi:APA family basic amino acid/polyamine antiporter
LGLSISGGSLSNALTPASDYDPAAFNSGLGMAGVLFAAMLGAFWAYEGWLNLGFIGEEVKDPQRNIPLGLIIGILIVIAVYLAINFTYLYVIPMDEMIALAANENTIMAVVAVERFLGTPGLWFISLLIVITTLGCANTTILSAARIYYAMARNGQFARAAHRLHPRHNTPAGALVMQGIWSSLLVFSGTFDQLTDMLIFASFIFYGAIVFGVFVLRRRMPAAERPYRAIGYPIVPALFIVFCVALVIVTCIQQPREAFLGLFLIAMGTPFYVYWLRRYEQR